MPGSDLDPAAMLSFAAIARARGIRGAAAALGVPRSTVSRRLAELERQAGAALVVRTSRRFALTPLGLALAERCDELEELVRRSEELVRRSADEPVGRLRISAAPVIGEALLPSIGAELLRRYPRLSLDVRMSVEPADLRSGQVDVALRAGPVDDATDLYALRLGTATAGCWVSPSYAARHGVPRTPAELTQHECIVVGTRQPTSWTFRVGARDVRVDVNGRVRVNSSLVARDLAAAGAGVVRAAQYLAEPLVAAGELVPVLESAWPQTVLHAVHGGPNPPPPKVRVFLDLARDAARALLGAPRSQPPPARAPRRRR